VIRSEGEGGLQRCTIWRRPMMTTVHALMGTTNPTDAETPPEALPAPLRGRECPKALARAMHLLRVRGLTEEIDDDHSFHTFADEQRDVLDRDRRSHPAGSAARVTPVGVLKSG